MPHETEQPLSLVAKDGEDLTVLSTFLQDAIIPIAGMHYLRKENRFVMFCNRFRWELTPHEEFKDVHERVHAGICFSHVKSIAHAGFHHLQHKHHGLCLLAIQYQEPEIYMIFSGGPEVRLTVEKVDAHLRDMSEPWIAIARPRHPHEAEATATI